MYVAFLCEKGVFGREISLLKLVQWRAIIEVILEP